jgi:hypothetical protein
MGSPCEPFAVPSLFTRSTGVKPSFPAQVPADVIHVHPESGRFREATLGHGPYVPLL